MGLSADAYARMLKALLPPSRMWRLEADAVLSETLLACADELARVDGRVRDLLAEADPRTATELLPEWEKLFELEPVGTLSQRRARVVSLVIRRQRFRPIDFQNVLAPVLGLDPSDVDVIEVSHAAAVTAGNARLIFTFKIYRDPGLPGSYDLVAAQKIVEDMKPSHTWGRVTDVLTGFLCDDPGSLCDFDTLGV